MNTMWVTKVGTVSSFVVLLALPAGAATTKPLPSLNAGSLEDLMKSAHQMQGAAMKLKDDVLAHPDVQKVLKDKDLAKLLKNIKIPTNEVEALNTSEVMIKQARKKIGEKKYQELMKKIADARAKIKGNAGKAIAGAKAQALEALKKAMKSPTLSSTQKAELAKKLKELQSK